MKIISIGNFGFGWDNSICDEEHIASTLEKMGNTVQRVSRTSTALMLPIEQFAFPDLVLVAQWDGYPVNFMERLRENFKCLIVYWAFDYQADGQEWHEHLVNGADLYLSKRFADIKYENWRWFSQDFAPSFLDKYQNGPVEVSNEEMKAIAKGQMAVPGVEKDIDVLFTGTYLDWAKERNDTLKAVDEKFNLVIHSVNPEAWKEAGFKNVNGPVMDAELMALVARAKVNLSIDHTQEAGYWSDRNAQIMACGGFVLFRYVPLSETVFRRHVGYFYSPESAVTQVGAWLKNDEARESVAQMGYYYARENLMVQHRVAELIFIIGSVIAG